jgi:hypothetical protein
MINPKSEKFEELRMLICELVDDAITPESMATLNQILANDPDAVNYYIDFLDIQVLIKSNMSNIEADVSTPLYADDIQELTELWRQLAKEELAAPEVEDPQKQPQRELIREVIYPPRQKRKVSKLSIAFLAMNIAAILFFFLFLRFASPEGGIEVATLNAVAGAQWSDSADFLKSGDRIRASEVLSLADGLVGIKTDNDVDLIIEGPAEFDFTKEGDLRLGWGKVYAVVSAQGIGFTVTTSTSKIIDLGTEFGVQADRVGSTEAHVYKGQVTLVAGGPSIKKLKSAVTEGQARLINADGAVSPTPVNDHLFVRKEEFLVNVRASQGSGYDRWLAYSYKLRRNPDLVAYYTFEQDASQPDILANKAIATEGRLDGELYSALDGPLPTWTTGRWLQKTALHFNRKDRQVVVVSSDPVVHITGPITIAAWVRCSEPRDGGHIVSCRLPNGDGNYQLGYKSPREEDAWTGKIQFGRIKYVPTESLTDRIFSKQIFAASPQWRFVGVTHDNQTVKMYVDGRYIETHEFVFQPEPLEADLVIGADRIEGDPSRFKGDMDELMIFNRVLDAGEIGEIYQAGRPE